MSTGRKFKWGQANQGRLIISLIPAFEIGLWNAWIFMLLDVLTFPLFFRVATGRAPEVEGKSQVSAMSRIERIALYSSKAIYIPAFIYSIFLPLKLGTVWFYVGLPITLIGFITGVMVILNWATSPRGKPVTNGLYRYSRHPMYVTAFIFFLGVSIATASWVFLLFTILLIAASFYFAPLEEQSCLEKYGDAYREYMNRTPRYIGIPKSEGK
jgi:protein-S-isoprenylcysteine O-methyltransferase Ste14